MSNVAPSIGEDDGDNDESGINGGGDGGNFFFRKTCSNVVA